MQWHNRMWCRCLLRLLHSWANPHQKLWKSRWYKWKRPLVVRMRERSCWALLWLRWSEDWRSQVNASTIYTSSIAISSGTKLLSLNCLLDSKVNTVIAEAWVPEYLGHEALTTIKELSQVVVLRSSVISPGVVVRVLKYSNADLLYYLHLYNTHLLTSLTYSWDRTPCASG